MEVPRDIVNPYEIQTVDAEAIQTVLDRAQRAVRRIVVDDAVGPTELEESRLLAEVAFARFDLVENQSAYLGAEHIFVSLVFRQYSAEAYLGQTGAVERRRVEVASALLPGGLDRCQRFVFGDVTEHIPQWRGTKAERTANQLVFNAHDDSESGDSSFRDPTERVRGGLGPSGQWPLFLSQMLAEEGPHERGDLVTVRFEGEVAGVKQVELQRLQVALVRLGPLRGENLVVLTPGDQHRRLVLAEVLLPLRVKWRVAAVAQEEVELDLVVPLAVEQELVVGGPVRADEFGVLQPVRVLPLRRVVGQHGPKGVSPVLAGR